MNNTQLPNGWTEAQLSVLNDYKTANLEPSHFSDEVFELFSVPVFPTKKPEYLSGKEIGSSKQIVAPNDILLCKINPRINRVWSVKQKSKYRQIASSEWIIIRQPLINIDFLRYQLSEKSFRDRLCADVAGVGGSLTRAQPKKVATYEIRIAPLAEQKEIASLLDNLLAQVDILKTRLDAIPNILKRFRQSVLAAAVSGKLTGEWREGNICQSPNLEDIYNYWLNEYQKNNLKYKTPNLITDDSKEIELPFSWINTQLGFVFDVYVGATPSRNEPDFWEGNVHWVSSSEVAFCKITNTKEKITDKGLSAASTKVHPVGTVMLAMIGQGKTRGQAAILDIEACHNQNTAALRIPVNFVISEYLYFFLVHQYEETRRFGGGNNQQALNKTSVQSLPFFLPPIEEQEEIVRRVEELFAFADQIEQRVRVAQQRVNHLTQAILAKAFRGELTAEWREQNPDLISGENSAAALLAQIQASNSNNVKASRHSK